MKSTFTNTAEISHHVEGFLEIRLLDTTEIFDLDEAKRQFEIANHLAAGEDYLVLINTVNSTVQPTKEAQEYLMKLDTRIAEAVIVKSLPMRILVRFYVRGIKSHPIKIFQSRQKAIDWLLSHKK